MKISKEFKIGLFAIISITLLYLGFNFLKGIDFFSTNKKYYTIYDNIDGLQLSNSVIINGLVVGRVSDIVFQQQKNYIVVELDIKGDILLDDSTKAYLTSEGLLGGKAIELYLPKQLGNPLDDGDTILSDVALGLVESLTEQTLPVTEDIGVLLKKFSTTLDNFHETEILLRESIKKLNSNLDQTYLLIHENRNVLNATLENVKGLTANLETASENLDPLLVNANSLVDSLRQLEIDKTLANLNTVAENLNSILGNLKEGEGTLGKMFYNDSLYVNLNKTAEDLDKLMIDMRENPRRYVHFSVFGKKDKSDKEEE